jgi:hypothetical protein
VTAGRRARRVVLLGTAVGLGLVILEVAVPRGLWSGLAALVSLVPVALALALGGWPAASLATAVAATGVAAMAGASAVLVILLKYALPGATLGLMLVRRWSLAAGLALVSTVSLVGLAALLWAFLPAEGSPLDLVRQQLEAQVSELERLGSRLGPGGDPGWPAESARIVAATMRVAGPSVVLLGLFLTALVNYVLMRACLRGERFRSFSTEAVSDHLVWSVIGGGLLLVSGHRGLALVGLNVLIALAPLYAIQGLAVLRHFCQRVAVPRLLQIVGFALFAVHPLLLVVAACLGLSDLWVDFRKIRRTATPA